MWSVKRTKDASLSTNHTMGFTLRNAGPGHIFYFANVLLCAFVGINMAIVVSGTYLCSGGLIFPTCVVFVHTAARFIYQDQETMSLATLISSKENELYIAP